MTAGLFIGTINAASGAVGTGNAGSERIDNFLLLDHQGQARELYYQRDATTVVIVAHRLDCKAMADDLAQLAALAAEDPALRLWLLNPVDDATALDTAAGVATPILEDRAQAISRSLGFTHAGEAIVIDTDGWTLRYRGSVKGAAAALQGAVDVIPAADTAGQCPLSLEPQPAPADYA
ncbi:MAG: hypothetical protein AAGE43_02805, partial [Pseudomonadota bacterium]